MTKLGVASCATLLSFSVFASCAGDDEVKQARDTDAGAGGLEAGTGGDVGAGGSSRPAAGEGGTATSLGGEGGGGGGVAPVGGEAGSAPAVGGAAGALGEAGSGGVLDCPAQPGNFTYSCAQIVESWTPTFDSTSGRFELHLGELEFPIVSGTLDYAYEDVEVAVACGSLPVTGEGDNAFATAELTFIPAAGRIKAIDLVDACGGHHVFDQNGVPACNELRGEGFSGVFTLTCDPRFLATCPELCD